MKQKFKWLLALVAMVASINLMWGAAKTYSMTPDQTTTGSSATAYITSLTEFTHDEVSWKMNQWNPKTLQIKTNQSSASSEFRFYNTSAFAGKITQVVVKFSALTLSNTTTTGFKFVGGSSEVSGTTGGTDGVWNSTAKTLTWTPDAESNYTYFAMYQNGKVATGTNNLATADAIVVTYEKGDTPSGPTLESIYFTDDAATKLSYTEGDVFDPAGLVVMGKYSEGDDKDVTEDVEWSFSPETLAKTTTSVTVTASIEGVADAQKVVSGLTVTAAPKYTKVTTNKTDWSGEYLLVYEKDGTAYVWTGVDASNSYATATITSNQIAKPATAAKLIIASMTGGYSIQVSGGDNDGKYVDQTKYDNGMSISDSPSANTLSHDGTNTVIAGSGASGDFHVTMRYNNTSGQDRFRYYKSGQQAIQLYEKVLDPISSAVTFAAPEGGSLVIKNSETPIATGATIQDGTVLDVEFGMTPAEAYKDVAIKVTKTDGGDDVTSTVYNGTKKQITMPRYAITVAVTFTKLYKISLTKDGDGTGTATINGSTETIYVGEDDEITLVAEEGTGSEFGGWTATDNIVIDKEGDAETFAYAGSAGTITATFNKKQCTILNTPQNIQVTDKTYSGAKLTWDAVANADFYEVYITKGAEEIESDIVEETEYTISATLSANTEYSYSVVAGSYDEYTYCASNPAEGNFTTADYPAVTLTLSENGNTTPVNGKLNTPIELPTTSTQACDGKVFVGWSENPIEGEAATATLLGETYTFTEPSVLEKTIYAVYAKENQGTTTNWEITSLDKPGSGTGYTPYNGSHTTDNISYTTSQIMMSSEDKLQFQKNAGYIYNTTPFNGDILSITIADITSNISVYEGSAEITTTPTSGAITLADGKYTFSKGKKYFHIKMGNATGYSSKITVAFAGESTYSNYCTTCEAAVAVPTFSLDEGEYNEAQTLTLSATEGDIYYTINDGEETKYTAAIALNNRGTYEISAYAKVDDRTSDIVTKTYTLDWPYESLEELVAANVPSGTMVTVSFSNVVINSFNGTKGVNLNVQCEGKNIQIYNSTAFDPQWKVGGTLSKSNLTCTWSRFVQNSEFRCWELMPANWEGFVYNDPVHITSIAISGEPTNKDYSDGQQLNPAGLVVTGTYSDSPEHTEVITEGLTWTLPTLAEGATTAKVTVKYTEPILSTPLTSEEYEVTINAVTPAKTLQSIYIADDSEHKDAFFVGRPFSSDGLKVMAKYNIGEDQAIIPTSVTPPAMTSAGTKQVTVSYTEGGVTADAITYDITLTYMNLSDLVAATDIEKDDYVYVSFENVKINGFYTNSSGKRYGIYLDVQKSSKDIEIYCNSAEHDATWKQYGTVSATFDNVKWTEYNGTWELTPSSWEDVTYTAPNIPVTSMEISPAEVSVGETKTTTLSIVYTPEHATNTGVTWAVTEGSEYASVDEEGVVTGLAVGTATITATLTADPTITATRTVTVTETPKCLVSYYVKGEVASTQNIAREEEGTLTYEPTLTVAGYTFAGWAEAAIAKETATATLISTYTPGAEETAKSVYAVFKRVDDSSPTYQQYAKVTSALTNWSGDYLIAYSDEIFANGQKGGTDDGAIGKQYVKVNPEGALSGNVVTKEWGDLYKVTLEEISAGSNTYVLKTQDGKYNYQTGNSNGLTSSATKATAAQYPISVTFTSENDVRLALGGDATGAVFRYNDQGFFRYYKDGGQKAVYLYKYDAGSALYTSNPVAKVKVTFNLDGGVGGCGTITVNEGEDVTLCEDAPTKDLNKFKAWSDGVNEYDPGEKIENVTADLELKALWIAKKQYTISFNNGGAAGTTPASIKDYEYNEVTLPVQGDLSNPGYIFGGWNDGETTYAGGAIFTMPEKNVSMTAVWVAKTNDKWYLVTSADQLTAGKQYAIVSNEKEAAMGAMVSGKTYMANVSASFNADKSMMIAIDPSAVILTLGGNATDGWTLSNNGQYLGSETVKNMAWSTEVGDDYKWEITIAGEDEDYEAEIENTVGYLCYNAGSPRFNTYENVQSKVQLYVLVPSQVIDDEVNASTLDDHADVTVNEGGNLLIDAPKTLGDIYVMEGGKVTIQGTATLTVNNFVIKSSMGGGKSGQVIGVTTENFTITGSAYFDVTLGKNGDPNQWHAFAVPFNVDAINGVYDLDDNKLTNEVNYAIMDYHGDVRAQGQYGWKKFRGIMTPGTFYLMTVDGERTTYRMKMNGTFSASSTTITVNQYASGTDTDAGWNGIANNQLGYSSLGVDVQVLNPTSYTYEVMAASTYNFTVGTPFFYQASVNGSVDLTAPNASENYAPRRVGAAEAKNIAVTLGNDNYTDRLYISATDEATAEYQIGRDLAKMTMTNAPAVPQIFAEAYGTKLCMVDAPMMYDEAVYALNLYAPANGEYTMGASQVEGYEVFLTQNGSVIWNLSMSEATVELTKGNNTEYGLILKATSGHAPTDINTLNGQESVQKFLYNSNIYIRHNNQTYGVTGQLVK